MKYKVRSGYKIFTNKDAEIIGHELEKLFPNGEVTPKELVRFASNKKSPLNKYFEWDDAIAAEHFRLHQARQIIRSLVVVMEDREVPAFHHVQISEDSPNKYLDVFRCMESPNIWDQVINSAIQEAERWSLRYQSYQELKPIHEAINQTKERINGKKEGSRRESSKERTDSRDQDTAP